MVNMSLTIIATQQSVEQAIGAAWSRGLAADTLARLQEQADAALEAYRSGHLSEPELLELLEGIALDVEALSCAA